MLTYPPLLCRGAGAQVGPLPSWWLYCAAAAPNPESSGHGGNVWSLVNLSLRAVESPCSLFHHPHPRRPDPAHWAPAACVTHARGWFRQLCGGQGQGDDPVYHMPRYVTAATMCP